MLEFQCLAPSPSTDARGNTGGISRKRASVPCTWVDSKMMEASMLFFHPFWASNRWGLQLLQCLKNKWGIKQICVINWLSRRCPPPLTFSTGVNSGGIPGWLLQDYQSSMAVYPPSGAAVGIPLGNHPLQIERSKLERYRVISERTSRVIGTTPRATIKNARFAWPDLQHFLFETRTLISSWCVSDGGPSGENTKDFQSFRFIWVFVLPGRPSLTNSGRPRGQH